MGSSPLISFVVPCYNYASFLPDCLNSIFEQQGDYNFEIIAVDDKSTDDTLEVLESFRDPRLRVLKHQQNQGHVKTVNEGLAATGGEFVARIDPDDRYRRDFLNTLLPKFDQHPEIGLAYGDASLIDANGSEMATSCDRIHKGRDFKGNELRGLLLENFICAPTAIARRAAWQQALPIPANLAFNDWYFNLMIARKYDFYYVNRVVADYRVHSANHHVKIVLSKTEEASIRQVLDLVFSSPESDPESEQGKQAFRGRAYSAQNLTLANKYFGAGYLPDARRCYLDAILYSPGQAASVTTLRRLLATFCPVKVYRLAKRLLIPGRDGLLKAVPKLRP